jgi:hypothetical protein
MLVLIAGTHGVEGHCGSGAEIAWLRNGGPAKLPKDTGALLIHAINPYGFAWTRRVTEDNVDLNRNFVATRPTRTRATRARHAIPPASGRRQLADQRCSRPSRPGASACRARSAAASTHPDGIFFGGKRPTAAIARCAHWRGAVQARGHVIDFHTGSARSANELICTVAPAPIVPAPRRFGDKMTSPESGTSTSAVVVGVMTESFPQELPDAEVTSIAIEYGTYTVPEVLNAVRADNLLHQRGDFGSAQGKAIKADIKERFFPAGDKWREMVWARADQTIGWALKGLAG